MAKNSNDFGDVPLHMRVYGREAVENRIAIRIFDVTKSAAWEEREILLYKFKINGIDMKLRRDDLSQNWYIVLLNPGPSCSCTIISLTTSKCRFGGCRYWFKCPDTDCHRRAGVLYRDGDDFRCRKCLNLDYRSHEVNYQSLGPAIRYMHKYEKIIDGPLFLDRFYKGKPTKKTQRLEELRRKAEAGFALYGEKYK